MVNWTGAGEHYGVRRADSGSRLGTALPDSLISPWRASAKPTNCEIARVTERSSLSRLSTKWN
jgi:hypothetical protein